MPKGKRPRQQGPQPKPKGNHTDKRHRRGSEKSRERHVEPDGPAKKLKSSWVPATQRQRKAARMREALKPQRGHTKTMFEVCLV